MIPKGCTWRDTFEFPFPKDDVKAIFITYSQKGKTVFEKKMNDCVFGEGVVSVDLLQEDTLKLDEKAGVVNIQIRVRLNDDTTIKSNILETYTDTVLKEGVI